MAKHEDKSRPHVPGADASADQTVMRVSPDPDRAVLPSDPGPADHAVESPETREGPTTQPPLPSEDRPTPPVAWTFAQGQLVARRYNIVRFIGRGGMGEVYEAEDVELRERVALKTIRPEIASNERAISRLKQEIHLARKVTHPNVCRIFDLGYESGSASPTPGGSASGRTRITFLTMELLAGETLAAQLSRLRRMTTREALPLVRQMAAALAAAHEAGVIHRDFKPSNVMLVSSGSPDNPKTRAVVTDFGLARTTETSGTATTHSRDDHIVGTLAYMAPEQLAGEKVTPAADVYALGLVMYEMVTGQPPFPADAPLSGVFKRLKEPPSSPREHVPDLDPLWESAILCCLHTDPASRFQSAQEIIEWLGDPAESSHSGAAFKHLLLALGINRGAPHFKRRRPLLVLAGVLLLFALVGSVEKGRWHSHPPPFRLPGRASILVADFENKTDEKSFDGTVSGLISQALTQSRYVTVVPRLIALEAARRTGRTDVKRIDVSLGREICIRENYRALLAGQVSKLGSLYRIDAYVVDPKNDSIARTQSETITSLQDLYSGLDRLSVRLRRDLGEALPPDDQSSRPLAQVTTPKLEALQRYSRSLDLYAAGDFYGSLAMAKSALDLDPKFAMAHLLMAKNYDHRNDEKGVLEEVAQAKAELNHATERERHLILAWDHYARYDFEKSAEEYRVLVELDPQDLEALRGLAESTFWAGQTEKAIEVQKKALELSPDGVFDYKELMDMLVYANRFREALQTYDQARSRKLDSPQLHWIAGVSQWGEGRFTEAHREFDVLHEQGDSYFKNLAQINSAAMLIYQGRMREAGELLRTGPIMDEQQSGGLLVARLHQLAGTRIMLGQKAAASDDARQMAKAARAQLTPDGMQDAGLLGVQLGDLGLAQQCLAKLQARYSEQNSSFTQSYLYTLKGAVQLAEGRADAAIESERRAAAFPLAHKPYLTLAHAYERSRDWGAATQAYLQYFQFEGKILRDDFPGDWVLAHLWLARDLAKAGDTQRAIHRYEEFLQIWKDADAELAVLEQARREKQKLESNLPPSARSSR